MHSALNGAEKVLLANHLDRCVTEAIQRGGEPAAQVKEEIVDLLYRYVR